MSACGAELSPGDEPYRSESFPFEGQNLLVRSDFSKVDIREGSAGGVEVAENRTTLGTGADSPQWTLTDGVLDLGRPCGGKSITIGLCEITYAVTVPAGTRVSVESED